MNDDSIHLPRQPKKIGRWRGSLAECGRRLGRSTAESMLVVLAIIE
jgi:hypothetical protein